MIISVMVFTKMTAYISAVWAKFDIRTSKTLVSVQLCTTDQLLLMGLRNKIK